MKSITTFINESKLFTLNDDERNSLCSIIGIMLGNEGDDEEIKSFKDFKDSLSKDEINQFDDLYNVLNNNETYPKISYRLIKDDVQLIHKFSNWLDDNDMIGENWDLMDALDKINI